MRIAMKEEMKQRRGRIRLPRRAEKHGLLGSDEEPSSSDDESEDSTDVDTLHITALIDPHGAFKHAQRPLRCNNPNAMDPGVATRWTCWLRR